MPKKSKAAATVKMVAIVNGEKADQLLSKSGRVVPFPPFVLRSRDQIKHNRWLLDNAIAEAQANQDEWVLMLLGFMNDRNFPQGDRDMAHMYLFGTADSITILAEA